jgi:hypothetical protein
MNLGPHFTYSHTHEVAVQGLDESWSTLYILTHA